MFKQKLRRLPEFLIQRAHPICKPNSVEDDHLSGTPVSRAPRALAKAGLHQVGVFLRVPFPTRAVGSYFYPP